MEKNLSAHILAYAERLPEGTPLAARTLLHLGTRAGVHKALSRLAARGQLVRAERGVYLRPVTGRFGRHSPSIEQVVKALAMHHGEIIVPNGAAAANVLGLTTQVPVRPVYLTSGRSRTIKLGQLSLELRHAPPWQTALVDSPAGQAVRALAWLGPEHTDAALPALKRKLSSTAFRELLAAAPQFPNWLALSVDKAAHG